MALETVLITKRDTDKDFDTIPATQKFYVHQMYSEYGLDEIGNPYYLGEDYDIYQIEPLTWTVSTGNDSEQFEHGEIYYKFNVREGIWTKEVVMSEAMFTAFCLVEMPLPVSKYKEALEGSKGPLDVRHKNGDKYDNTKENLEWIYTP